MRDDLLQRLRSLAVINPQIPGNNAGCRTCGEAADEIERLQAVRGTRDLALLLEASSFLTITRR